MANIFVIVKDPGAQSIKGRLKKPQPTACYTETGRMERPVYVDFLILHQGVKLNLD